jgi:branched-chain amino acid transport system substrate-binding protein
MSRRRVLASAASRTALAGQPPVHWPRRRSLKLCQSTALSGAAGGPGLGHAPGGQGCLHRHQRQRRDPRPQILLQTLDDGYEVPRALANLDTFLADKDCFALFNCMGTPMVEAMLPKVQDSGMPFFAPFTGGQLSRIPGARNVFNIRASYAEEAEKCIQHLATLGIQRIAVVQQNNVPLARRC